MSAREQNQEREPRRLIMIGYDSLEKLVSDGKIRLDDIKTLELQFNFGKMFDEVLYVVPFGRKNDERRVSDTIIYRELAFERKGSGFRKLVSGLNHVQSALAFLNKAVSDFHPDVVQTVGPHYTAALALLAGKVRALPKVCFIEAYWEDILPWQNYFHPVIRRLLPLWYRIVYRLFDRYSGAPSLASEFYTRRGMALEKISPWIQPLDFSEVNEAAASDAPPSMLSAPTPRIVVLGRLHPEKLAPDAFRIFADAVQDDLKGTLIFVGEGADRAVIESEAKARGLQNRIVITGQVSHRIAMAALKASDYSIAPMQGSALLETLAAGIPTIAYDHETHAALIETGVNGILVPHRDVKAASIELRKILSDSALAKKLGQKAYDRVAERYNVNAMRKLLKTSFVDAYHARKKTSTPSHKPNEEGLVT